ncbi:hypothetical protein AYI69_g1774 [Smittium culicis]|uniref:Uncharacterized protein n=1 Tax=Smittium culicis TaxID=133412 RepID=A0A1R1YPC5_9FUNG|nr:hypothetical protein AYI69_g1774 [Smittium culicis]
MASETSSSTPDATVKHQEKSEASKDRITLRKKASLDQGNPQHKCIAPLSTQGAYSKKDILVVGDLSYGLSHDCEQHPSTAVYSDDTAPVLVYLISH